MRETPWDFPEAQLLKWHSQEELDYIKTRIGDKK